MPVLMHQCMSDRLGTQTVSLLARRDRPQMCLGARFES
jgi:hypothetical protein